MTRPSRSSSKSPKAAAGRGGKVPVSCPQCGAEYRMAPEQLDVKIECSECHRVFFPKTTAGKRAHAPDHSKLYLLFGGLGLALVVIFVVISQSNKTPPPKPKPPEVKKVVHSPSDHPRTLELVKWGQAVGSGNPLVIQSHSDLAAVAKVVEAPSADPTAVLAALKTHESTRYLRELDCDSGMLADEATMTAPSGKCKLFVTPKSGTDDYRKNTRGELEVDFRMDGDQVKVTGWTVTMKPSRNPNKPDPNAPATFVPNQDIAKPVVAEITDSAGTRKVRESQPAAVPHWGKSTDKQKQMADKIVADLLASADPEAPGTLFGRAVSLVKTNEDRQAVVPRVLNAMFECYGDVNANNQKLSQLNRALVTFTGYAVNYQIESSGDAQKDKTFRESCVRQWFAFWYRYSGDLSQFFDTRDNLEEPLDGAPTNKK